MGELVWPKCVGMLGWFKWVWVLGWLELAFPTACSCLYKVRPGVLSKTLSHIWGKLNLPINLFNAGLFTLINIDSLIFLAKPCPPSLLFASYTKLYQYLQWDHHHHLSAKYSKISTLTHRAQTICSNPELLQKEMEHLMKALTNCKYPKWALDKVKKRLTRSTSEVNDGTNSQGTAGTQPVANEVKTKGHIVIPYTQGLYKSIKKVCGRYGIQNHFKGNSTIKTYCSPPRTKNPWSTKVGPYTGSSAVILPAMMNT